MTNTRQAAIEAVRGFRAGLQTRLDSWPAYTGDGRGNLRNSDSDSQYMLVRWPLATSPAVEVLNESIPDVENLRVMVGYTADQPDVLRILSRADSRADNTNFVGVMNHSQQHGYLAADMDWIDFRRVLSFRVIPYSNLNVYIYGGVLPVGGTFVNVANQVVDMTASVPVSGARYAAISVATDGTITVTDGSTQPTAQALTIANVPAVPSGEFRLAAVLLRAGQTSITETLAQNDLLDLRWPQAHLESTITPSSIAIANQHFIVGNASNVGADAGAGLTYATATNRLSVDNVQFDLTPTPTSAAEGLMYWNVDDGTLNLGMPGGNVNLQIGQELIMRAKNETGSPITNGQLVYISSGTGSNAIISLAKADAELTSATTIGMATEAIANNQFGYVTLIGLVRDVNTIAYTAGTSLYLSAATAGAYVSTKPVAPNHLVTIGVVIRQHATEGVIFVRIDNGYELSELHDVYINSIADGNILQYVNANSRWENKTLASAGLVSGTGTTNYVTKFTGTSTIGDSLIRDDGTTVGIATAPISSALLDIRPTSTLTSGTFNGETVTLTANPGGSSSGVFQALSFAAATQSGNAQNFTQSVRGVVGQAQHGGTGTVTTLTGVDVQTQINSSGNVTTSRGMRISGVAGSTGRATTHYGLEIDTNHATTTVNTALSIVPGSAAGNLKYGISIGAITGGSGANVAIETLGGQLQFTHNANSTLATFTGHSTFTAATPLVLMTRNDAATNAVVTNLTLRANTTGTAANQFGSKLAWQLESSTTASQNAGAMTVLWTDATHATLTSRADIETTGPGHCAAWGYNGVDGTARYIINNVTGDVTEGVTVQYVASEVTGTESFGGVVYLEPSDSFAICTDGTNTLTLTCAADGSLYVQRSAGTDTFKFSCWAVWQ